MENTEKNIISIDKGIKINNKITLFAVVGIILVALLSTYTVYNTNKNAANNVFVLDQEGNISNASKNKLAAQLEPEADNHLRMFYATFFSYDVVNVDDNVKKGIELGGESVKELWRMYNVENWYDRVKQSNLIVKSTVDSTFFDFKTDPYRARVYGSQIITNGNVSEKRTLNIDCVLIEVGRIKNKNPHGLLIDKIVITSNTKIE